jgi:tetratricopeptide (TPR) repeat protein
MIRRDYILRMIEEMIQALARIASLTKAKQHCEAAVVLDQEFQKLIGSGAETVATLSETELIARVLSGESTQIVREKTLLLVALLKEAGGIHAALNRTEESRACYLKALNLLLQARLQEEDGVELPGYVPKIDDLELALKDSLPSTTRAALMQHYERLGDFAGAEDQLFEILELEANARRVLDWGIAFYERLQRLSDDALVAGNLPRSELESGLAELQTKRQAACET